MRSRRFRPLYRPVFELPGEKPRPACPSLSRRLVGSSLRPAALKEACTTRARRNPDVKLAAAEDAAIEQIIARQAETGLRRPPMASCAAPWALRFLSG
jgi:hypothetical protein